MQRASLRRAGRAWAVIAAAWAGGCGDDGVVSSEPPGTTGSTGSTGDGTSSGDEPNTSVMTGGPTDPPTSTSTVPPTTGEPDSSSSGDPTTGPSPTTGDDTTTGGVNAPPVALQDDYKVKAKLPLTPQAPSGVLANDYDPDGDPLEVVSADPLTPGGAQVTMFPNGAFNYLPPADLWGDDSFQYKIWDTVDGFAMATVRVGLSPTAIPLAAVAAGRGGFVIDGEASEDYSGRAVHHLRDLNDDGFGEVVVAARAADADTGKVYVVFGKANPTPVALATLAEDGAGFAIVGAAPGELAGNAVGDAGDVNGDGLPDLVIGAPKSAQSGIGAGSTYVVFGQEDPATVYLDQINLGVGGFAIQGANPQDASGTSARGAGDVNGDGRADIVVGALGADPHGAFSGSAYVVFGRDAGKPTKLAEVAQGLGGGFAMHGVAAVDFTGAAVAGVGDVDGDGLADVLVGAYGSDVSGDTAGRAYVVFGRTAVTPVELSDVAAGQGGFAIDGEEEFDQAGAAVGAAGDVDGDGLCDLLIGAPRADPTGPDSGRAYVVFGKADTAAVKLAAVVDGDGGFAIDGQQVRDYAGFAVDAAGDVDGDGLDDVIVGAYGANPAGDTSGRSYLVYGRTGGAKVQLLQIANGTGGFSLDGEAIEDYSGFSVGGAGDVNGDGLADLVVGAFGNDAKGLGAGRSYVVFGDDFEHVAREGGPGGDNLVGTAGADIVVAGRGSDTVAGMGGADVLHGGEGDDTFRVPDTAFRRISGGVGSDTLELTGAGLTLDLTTRSELDLVDLERIHLGDGGHTLVLERRDLLALVAHTHTLTVTGTQGDVEAALTGFQDLGEDDGFRVYSDGITTLRVQIGLAANITL
jgi:hypothetical protein